MARVYLATESPFGAVNAPPSWRYRSNETPVPSVTEVLSDVGLGAVYAGIPPDVLRNKARIGSAVHGLIAEILSGQLRSRALQDRIAAYLRSWLDWYHAAEPFEVVACEVSYVWDTWIAGTFDCLVRRVSDGRWILFDWKTRKPAWYDGYQLAGYLFLAAANPLLAYTLEDLPRTERVIVSLIEGRRAQEQCYDDPADFEVFRSAIQVWHARKAA